MDYLQDLKEKTPTIFSPNCWGGLTYHQLGLPFMSPLINMWEDHDDYLRLLEDPHYYMSLEPVFLETCDNKMAPPYPVVMLGDVKVRMNHYRDYAEAMECWHRRVKRIKWDDLFVMLWDEDPLRVERFLSLPFDKKVCFVPWETHIEGCISVPYRQYESLKDKEFWQIMNMLAQGRLTMYDPVTLLHDGEYKKTGDLIMKS